MDQRHVASFGPFTFDRLRLVLRRDGQAISIGGRAAALLRALVEANGEVVTRSELMDAAWPGQVVEERNLNVQIAGLRKAMGDGPDGEDPIRTVSRVGYRLALDAPAAPGQKVPSIRPSVAVLPFANLSPDPELSYFADGVSEDLITALSRFKSFAVIARSASFAYKDRLIDLAEAAQGLGVRYVVEGSVRRSGQRVRVSARLTDAVSERQLWGETFEGALGDIFDVQDRIAECVVGLVEPHITQAEVERARRKRPESLDAYDHFLRGLSLFPGEDVNAALDHFDRAVELDPTFPQALAFAGWLHEVRRTFGVEAPPGTDDFAVALALTERALKVAGNDALVLGMVGFQFHLLKDDAEAAFALTERALALNPNNELLLNQAGTVYLQRGHYDRAVELYERALRLSPGSTYNYWALQGIAEAHLKCGRLEEAVTWAKRSLATATQFELAQLTLIVASVMLDRMVEARAVLEQYLRRRPGVTIADLMENLTPGTRRAEEVWVKALRKAGLPEA